MCASACTGPSSKKPTSLQAQPQSQKQARAPDYLHSPRQSLQGSLNGEDVASHRDCHPGNRRWTRVHCTADWATAHPTDPVQTDELPVQNSTRAIHTHPLVPEPSFESDGKQHTAHKSQVPSTGTQPCCMHAPARPSHHTMLLNLLAEPKAPQATIPALPCRPCPK